MSIKQRDVRGKDEIETEFDLTAKMSKVHSSLPYVKGNVSEDFVLAQLNKDEREFIETQMGIASYCKGMGLRYKKGYSYAWNNENKDYERNEDNTYKKIEMTEEEQEEIEQRMEEVYGALVNKAIMMVLLRRNIKDNYLPTIMTKFEKKDKQESTDMDLIESIKMKVKGEDKDEN